MSHKTRRKGEFAANGYISSNSLLKKEQRFGHRQDNSGDHTAPARRILAGRHREALLDQHNPHDPRFRARHRARGLGDRQILTPLLRTVRMRGERMVNGGGCGDGDEQTRGGGPAGGGFRGVVPEVRGERRPGPAAEHGARPGLGGQPLRPDGEPGPRPTRRLPAPCSPT